MTTKNAKQRASGCLFGLAFGDALGAATEFLNVGEILQRFPPQGPLEPTGDPARVTDDTQMALAVGEALIEAHRPFTARTLEEPLRRAFVARKPLQLGCSVSSCFLIIPSQRSAVLRSL